MKIVAQDKKTGKIKLRVDNLDDIWHLYNIIEEGDLIRAITFRTPGEDQQDKIRSSKQEKKKMKLGVRVEKVEFHEFSDRLRVNGVIEEGPQDHGSHHTINISTDDQRPFSIIKENWKDHQLDRLREAVEATKQPVLTFVSLDEDNAVVAILRQSGLQTVTTIKSDRQGKMYEGENTEKEYYGEILSVLRHHTNDTSPVVIVGPGFAKEKFLEYGKQEQPSLFSNVVTYSTGNSGMNGVYEAIKAGIVDKIAKDHRVSDETNLVEKIFKEIAKNGLATYGKKEVQHALENGAVETLLIIDKLARTKEGEELLRMAKKTESKFMIVNTMHEPGEKLEGIGGVAALLRFKI